jgi:hypothetical protein
MDDRCLACHEAIAMELDDESTLHGGLLTAEPSFYCRSCHPEHLGANASLTMVDPERFPHQVTGFSLDSHRPMPEDSAFSCAACHGEPLSRFAPETCTGCHRDLDQAYMQRHEDAFGQACLSCLVGKESYGAAFDHVQLAFPLTGRLVQVDCIGCHEGARSVPDLQAAPTDCYACHAADDAHDGSLGQDCAACHVTDDWQQATIDHDLTAFPLTGAHIDVACQECHQDQSFAGTPTDCVACHGEPGYHAGLLGIDCRSCHTTAAWTPAQFDRAHTFPLTHGRPQASACRTCHPSVLVAYTCYTCHEHEPGDVEEEHRDEGITDIQDCASCHPTGREKEGDDD